MQPVSEFREKCDPVMKLRAVIFGILFLALAVLGLYAVPLLVRESGVIASSGATFAIHIGSWETIPFSLTHTSKITGSFAASAPINFLVMNSTQMDLLVHGGEPPYTGANALSYGVGTVYEVAHVTSFVFDVTLAPGDYFLIFSCECGIVSIHITSSIIARTNPTQ